MVRFDVSDYIPALAHGLRYGWRMNPARLPIGLTTLESGCARGCLLWEYICNISAGAGHVESTCGDADTSSGIWLAYGWHVSDISVGYHVAYC